MTLTELSSLSNMARSLCDNAADAEDLVQDTVERVLRADKKYVEQGKRIGYLATVLRNRFRDGYRARRRFESADVLETMAAEGPSDEAWTRVTEEKIENALAQLEPPFRKVWEMYACGSSYAEIARRLDIAQNTVGTRLSRARAKLRALLVS